MIFETIDVFVSGFANFTSSMLMNPHGGCNKNLGTNDVKKPVNDAAYRYQV
jgi:hypothetical protein